MGDLFFLIKTLIGTFVIVVLLQIKVGNSTVEHYVMDWIHNSEMAEPIQEAAHGGVVFIRESWKKLTAGIDTGFSKSLNRDNIPGSRSLGISMERSKAYLREQAQRATDKIKAEVAEQSADELEPVSLPQGDPSTPRREWSD